MGSMVVNNKPPSLALSSTLLRKGERKEFLTQRPKVKTPAAEGSNFAPLRLCVKNSYSGAFKASATSSACSFWWILYDPVAGLADALRPT